MVSYCGLKLHGSQNSEIFQPRLIVSFPDGFNFFRSDHKFITVGGGSYSHILPDAEL